MAQKIEISVIIPNYNYGQYIEECINSVLASDFNHAQLEIVVVDDASTDNSVKVINKIKEEANIQINLIKNKTNQGLAKTRNNGIKAAKGKFLFFLDSDNYINVDCLTKHHEFLSSHKEYSACYAPIQRFDGETKELTGIFSNEPYDFNRLAYGNYIDAMAMIKKKDLLEIGPYDEQMPYSGWEDYELWLRMGVNNKKVHFIEGEPLTQYRVHKSSMINSIPISHLDELRACINTKFNIIHAENIDGNLHEIKAQVYYSQLEFDFSEENSLVKKIILANSASVTTFNLPQSDKLYKHIRFDLGDKPGLINIHQIEIKNIAGEVIWQWDRSTIHSKRNLFLFRNEELWPGKIVQISPWLDPNFSIITNEEVQRQSINGVSIEISLSSITAAQFESIHSLTTPLRSVSEDQFNEIQSAYKAFNSKELEEITIKIKEILKANESIVHQIINDKNSFLTEINAKNDTINKLFLESETLNKEIALKEEYTNNLVNERKEFIHKLTKEKENHSKELAEKENHILELATTINDLHNKLANQNLELTKLQIEKSNSEATSLNNTQQIFDLKAEKNKKETEINVLNKVIIGKNEEILHLQQNKLQSEELLRHNKEVISSLTIEKSKKEAEIDVFIKHMIEITHQNKNLINISEEHQRKLNQINDDYVAANKHITAIESTLDKTLQDNKKLEESEKNLNMKLLYYIENYEQKNIFQIAFNRITKKTSVK